MRVLDLFCGAGGFSKGFEQAGFDVRLAIDNASRVEETFEANHSDTVFLLENISEITASRIKEVNYDWGPFDVIIGSPPCTNFSSINPRKNRDGTHLVEKFFHFVRLLKPDWWLMENVYETGPYIQKYDNSIRPRIINAANFGVPQLRKRLFFGNYPEPLPTHSDILGQTQLSGYTLLPWVTMGEVLESNVTWGLLRQSNIASLIRSKTKREGWNVPFPDLLDRPARAVLASSHKRNQNTFVIEDGDHYRLLTIREHARLQGFPDSYLWIGSYTDVIHMIGNAVPPPVAYAIAKAIKEARPEATSISGAKSTTPEECG